jgi:hypothetical protein
LFRGFVDRDGLGRFAGLALLRSRSLEPRHRLHEHDNEEYAQRKRK